MVTNSYKKTIFLSVQTGWTTRNILRSDAFKIIKSHKDLRIVLLSKMYKDKDFRKEFGGNNIVFENLLDHQNMSWFEWRFRNLRNGFFAHDHQTDYYLLKLKSMKHTKFVDYLLYNTIIPVLSRIKGMRNLMKKLEISLFPSKYYDKLLKKYNPDLIFCSSIYDFDAFPLLRMAKKNNFPIIGMVLSWDNLSSNGVIPVRPDALIVWNKIMEKEAMDWHNYKKKNIYVSGAPQFDIYAHNDSLLTRDEFINSIGGDKSKKLITYCTSTMLLAPFEAEIIEIISNAIKNKKIKYPAQILVRVNNRDDFKQYDRFKKDPDVTVKTAYKVAKYSDKANPSREEMAYLGSTMKNSDVIVNVASTITIEACIFNTPVVNIGFDGYTKKPYHSSVLRYYDYTHFKRIVKRSGFKIAKSEKELIKHINLYLENPSQDSDGRRKIVQDQCFKIDGNSGKRIANAVLDFLEKQKK